MSQGIFITATATDAGKTYVSAGLLKQLLSEGIHAGYYKAAASDAHRVEGSWLADDLDTVRSISGVEKESSLVSYTYHSSVSPHLAAVLEQRPIERSVIKNDLQHMLDTHEFLIVEGSGGMVCPLRLDEECIMLSDVMRMSGFALLIVADAGLGTINSCMLSVHYAQQLHIPIAGFLLNHYHDSDRLHQDNKKTIELLSGYPVLGCLADNEPVHLNLQRLFP